MLYGPKGPVLEKDSKEEMKDLEKQGFKIITSD